MAGKTLDIQSYIHPDMMAEAISSQWMEWDMLRAKWKSSVREVQQYVYSTDTTTTANNVLPWKNKTTLPKLCQIRDNIYANYDASLFPKSGFVEWQGANRVEQGKEKKELLESYCEYFLNQPSNKEILKKLILDYIDYGNVFAMVDWTDKRVESQFHTALAYAGPQIVRIHPNDIVFNPIAPTFADSPKIVRSLVTMGELKRRVEFNTFSDDNEAMQAAYDYLRNTRLNVAQAAGEFDERNNAYAIDGFTSFVQYLGSNYCELLQFYGDYYDSKDDRLYTNAVITVADRHKILGVRENPSGIAYNRIHHIGWRTRQDNLWAMGPLENLVGMQYRIDHLENLKADVFDLIAAPPLMVKGLVEDFEWGPFSRIYVGDDGDVKMMAPEGNVLSANLEIDQLERKMEEYAGSPKEAAGFRTPGEKTAYEVQRLENAANRIFYAKTKQFEEFLLEPMINEALDMARRFNTSTITIRSMDPKTNAVSFRDITTEDLSGFGRMKPVAARNFADKAEKVQSINAFFQSALGNDPEMKAHFSTVNLSRMFEELLDIEPYKVVRPYVRLYEQQEAQSIVNAGQEQIATEAMTPAGIAPDDTTGPISSNGMVPGMLVPGGKA